MTKQKKNEFTLTASGFEYDKELSRVSIKVFPALQALIANQHDFIEITKKYAPEKFIFLEAHLAELNEVEETVAKAHAKLCAQKEESKIRRAEKENNKKSPDLPPWETIPIQQRFDEPGPDPDALLDKLAATMSPGLPSSKYTQERPVPVKQEKTDIRRIAIGASINALSGLLGRELTEAEIAVIEKQVDAYL